jgi:hypothetical protein
MVSMRAEFIGPFGRHGRNLQRIEPLLRAFCVFKMFKKIEKAAACEMPSVIRFLNARNMKPADIHRHLCEVCGEQATSNSVVRRWVRRFNEGREIVHDDQRSGRPSVVNEDSSEQTIHHFVTFPAFSTNFAVTSSRNCV